MSKNVYNVQHICAKVRYNRNKKAIILFITVY